MAEVYGYFNGLEYDEKFPMMRVASLIPTGVYNDSLHVSAGTGLTVYVAAGKAWVDGYFYFDPDAKQITIDIADAEYSRKDIIVLRLGIGNPRMSVAYKKGNPSVYPTPPTLQRNNDQYELQLAEVLVPAGSTSIGAATITDTRSDSGLCGITAGFQGLDVAGLTAQAQAKFDTWFSNLKNQLDTNQAGNLQNQIDTINNSKGQPGGLASLLSNGLIPSSQMMGEWQNFTPSIAGETTAGNPAYSLRIGRYIKFGKLMYVTFYIQISSKGGMAGMLKISGWPALSSVYQWPLFPGWVFRVGGSTNDSSRLSLENYQQGYCHVADSGSALTADKIIDSAYIGGAFIAPID